MTDRADLLSTKRKVLITTAVCLFLALAVTSGYFLAYYRMIDVPTGAMANTIIPGDRVLCRIGGWEIKRGDIAIFHPPAGPKVQYLKRVIGLPGETIQIRGTKVFINGQELAESKTFVELVPARVAGRIALSRF